MILARNLGCHLIADLACAHGLDDGTHIENALRSAAEAARVTVIDVRLHHFGEGHGVTGVVLLAESHISIHTWPEHGLAAVDIFVCGAHARAEAALVELCGALHGTVVMRRDIDRLALPAI
ncbi:adenosylmethionine decarboxylase [Novosphingobium sp.]|uniref:adenosylmethionine decarboxylase n=1 Tax=Novosphingobium sp. TaxID=1874826 RepID=UPI003D117795